MKPANQYFSEDYPEDFKLLGEDSLCGIGLIDMMRQPKRGRFRGFPEFALCQFALNLHNQATYSHFPEVHLAWRQYSARFGNTLLCFSGHGLGSHAPAAILNFVQAPIAPECSSVRYDWAGVGDYIGYFFGEYLIGFADQNAGSGFSTEGYRAALQRDYQCVAPVLTGNGWECRHISSLWNQH